jgi:hypothetical protein
VVERLVSLDAAGLVAALRLALEVNDLRLRLVEDLPPRRAHGEGDVGVLVVRRGVAQVEAAEIAEQRRGDGEARAGAVVDLAQVVELRLVRVVVAAEIPRRAVAPDDAPGFLQPSIGIVSLCRLSPASGARRHEIASSSPPARVSLLRRRIRAREPAARLVAEEPRLRALRSAHA